MLLPPLHVTAGLASFHESTRDTEAHNAPTPRETRAWRCAWLATVRPSKRESRFIASAF